MPFWQMDCAHFDMFLEGLEIAKSIWKPMHTPFAILTKSWLEGFYNRFDSTQSYSTLELIFQMSHKQWPIGSTNDEAHSRRKFCKVCFSDLYYLTYYLHRWDIDSRSINFALCNPISLNGPLCEDYLYFKVRSFGCARLKYFLNSKPC